MRPFKTLTPLVLSAFLLCFSGCSLLTTKLQDPEVKLQQVEVSEAGLSDAKVTFNFLVANPNSVPLTVDQVDYRLQLNGKPMAKGLINQGLSVGANSSVNIPVPIRVNYTDFTSSLADLIQTSLNKGSFPYQLDGAVKVGLFSIPFQNIGELNLEELKNQRK